jgi:hypothetical protein
MTPREDATAAADTAAVARPTAEKEPKDMHTLTTEKTPRGRQLIRALALAHLLEQDLPLVRWSITPDDPALDGHVYRGDDEQARTDLEAVAEFLRAPVVGESRSSAAAEWTHLQVTATYRGTEVRIWAQVDHVPAETEETAR